MDTSILCEGAVLTVSAELSTVKVKVSYYMPRRHRGESESSARRGRVVSATPWPSYPRETDPVPRLQEAKLASGPVWIDSQNLATSGVRTPDRPAHSKSLYRLSYPQCLQFGPHSALLTQVPRLHACYQVSHYTFKDVKC
jgi:hypothetical protein